MAMFNAGGCFVTEGILSSCENPENAGFDPAAYPIGSVRLFAGVDIPDTLWKVAHLANDEVRWMQVR